MLGFSAILLVFYLVLLVKWSWVKRPMFFCTGALGLLLMILGDYFVVGGAVRYEGLQIVNRVFDTVGLTVAFVSALLACYPPKLPGEGKGVTAAPPQENK